MRLTRISLFALAMLSAAHAHAHSLFDGVLIERLPAWLTAFLLALFWLAYTLGSRRVRPSPVRGALFHATFVLAFLALLGPFDNWAKTSSAMHMVQHMLLMVVIAPLWVLAGPLPQLRAGGGAFLRPAWTLALHAARWPMAMAMLHGAAIWIWHAPAPYMLAVVDPWWHAFEHACFVGTAGLFWWAVLRAAPPERGNALVALLFTLMHTGLLGALLTFANTPLYTEAVDLSDQQLAGLIMWVPGGMVYLLAGGWCAWRWFRQLARRTQTPVPD